MLPCGRRLDVWRRGAARFQSRKPSAGCGSRNCAIRIAKSRDKLSDTLSDTLRLTAAARTAAAMTSDDEFHPRNFYGEWLRRSFRAALAAAGVGRPSNVMRNLLVWAIAVLALYFFPWSHVPLIGVAVEDSSHELRLGLCSVIAIIVVFVLVVIYQLLTQPSKMHNEAWQRIGELKCVLEEIDNVERDKVVLSQLHADGLANYRSFVKPDDPDAPSRWTIEMEKWVDSVRNHIKDRWSIATLHEFNDTSSNGGWSFGRGDDGLKDVRNQHGFELTAKYSGYIASVDKIIRFHGSDHLGRKASHRSHGS